MTAFLTLSPAEIISRELNVSPKRIEAVLALLADGATIPFISRYRKEQTGNLDEVAIEQIRQRAEQLDELAKRKEYIIGVIESQGKLTPELKERIVQLLDINELEDIYLPFKPRRRTRAMIAREKGLEPLADRVMSAPVHSLRSLASKYIGEGVATAEDALAGASDIIAETLSENEEARSRVRDQFRRFATVTSSVVKGKETEGNNFANYFDFSALANRCSSHNYLAMRRGESEGILKVKIGVDTERTLNRLFPLFIRRNFPVDQAEFLRQAVADGYKRLLAPSIESEISAAMKSASDDSAINTFAANLRQLLLASPLGAKRILAIDPGFRTGCKVVCLDASGSLLYHTVIYPTAPRSDEQGAAATIRQLLNRFNIEAIALGNGTASRETEDVLLKHGIADICEIYVVNENGASVYSASKIARDEFPDEDVTVRGAVSIGRRLVDPLAELVKIDPKSIGVGQYQHDVDQAKLRRALDLTVASCVNSVGVNVNTASPQLLAYVSGIGETLAANIVDYRNVNGSFTSREQLKKVPRLGPKAFEQAAGFIRVPESSNLLDNTAVHPERYPLIRLMAKEAGCSLEKFITSPELYRNIDFSKFTDENTGAETLRDIIAELDKPGRDPRGKAEPVSYDAAIRDIADLKPGMIVTGVVNNITDFGAFVDLGVHKSGLIHVSELSEKRVKHPADHLRLNQKIKVKVLDVDLTRGRISLSLRDVAQ